MGPSLSRFARAWFAVQGLAGLVWWAWLVASPPARAHFGASGAPDSALLAFMPGDLVFFVGGALAASLGVGRPWGWTALCVHASVAAYAAMYCLTLSVSTNSAWLATLFMLPSLTITPAIVWLSRPGGKSR